MTMATATTLLPSYDPTIPASSSMFHMPNDQVLSRQPHGFFTANTNPGVPRLGHCLDDMDILTLKRQYAHIDLFNQSALSNSAEDLSQIEHASYPCDIFGQDENDTDDYDIPYDDGADYDYNIMIQERLKKVNEEFEHDQTPAELKRPQRVSFDAVVKAVDIVQDPEEQENEGGPTSPTVPPIPEESTTNISSPRSETGSHEYTVPLNDIQPREGLTLLQQIKALQFHNMNITTDKWTTVTGDKIDKDAANHEDDASMTSGKSNENTINSQDTVEINPNVTELKKPMVVAVNGRFDLQDEDDYMAKYRDKSSNDDDNATITNNKALFLPAPPSEPRQKHDLPPRPFPVRPKSSDVTKRTDVNSMKLPSDKKNKTDSNDRQRPKSAGTAKTVETFTERPSSGVDFRELLRIAAEKKRSESREERRKKEEAQQKRQRELARAEECYQRWLQEKETERKRINEEKRLEKQEQEARQVEEEKKLAELREKKFKEWLERKDQEAKLANEFKKLLADENELLSGGSSSSINNGSKDGDHRAFQKWLRRKYEQSMEEKRKQYLETKRQRRRQRRSLKRQQLQLDLQLAKSYGYS